MPMVPKQTAPQVQAGGQNPTYMNTQMGFRNHGAEQAIEAGGAMVNAGANLAQIATDMQLEANKTVAKDVDTDVAASIGDRLYNANTGYLVQEGKNAVEGYQSTVDDLRKIATSAMSGVSNENVKNMLKPVIDARVQNAINTVNQHSGSESKRYSVQTSNSRAIITLQDAAFNYADDARFSEAMGVTADETANIAKINGWDETTAKLQFQKYVDSGYKMRYDAWAVKDPVGAFASFQRNAAQISPVVRDDMARQLFQRSAPVLAKVVNDAGGAGYLDADGKPAPRGVRNNNPGNVVKGSTQWEGEVTGSDPKYATFATPEAGIRAMGKTLLAYQDKHGLNTVGAIVSRWAPATENDTGAYASAVAKELGVKPDAQINLRDSATLNNLTKAMIRYENGKQPYTEQQIALGLAAASGSATLPPAKAEVRKELETGIALIDTLPADWKIHVMQLARGQAHQDMALARDQLTSKVKDATAEYMSSGFATTPPNEAEFIRAYGQADGAARYRAFQDVAMLGQTLQQVKSLPTSALSDMLEMSKPAPGDGFAVRQHNYEILTQAVDHALKEREKDPVAYAITTGGYRIEKLPDLQNSQGVMQELSRRSAVARQISADYGTELQVLTKRESSALTAILRTAPIPLQKEQLSQLYKGVGEDIGLFKQMMKSIAPEAPTIAVAGIYQARGLRTTFNRDVADLILRGQAILTPNKKENGTDHMGGTSLVKMPSDSDMLTSWNSDTGDAFKGREQAANLFMQTAKAIYAARSAEEGDYSGIISSNRWSESIQLATGGIQSHNGSKIVLPYGMPYDKFQNALQGHVDAVVKAGDVVNATSREMMRLPLENIGDGRYLFRRGSGYLVDKNGRPVTVDINGG